MRWKQQKLRPEEGGRFAPSVGEKLPECTSDLVARVCRDHAGLLSKLEGRIVDESFFVALREMGVRVDEGTVERWRRQKDGKQWVREDCGAGHRPSMWAFACERCGMVKQSFGWAHPRHPGAYEVHILADVCED